MIEGMASVGSPSQLGPSIPTAAEGHVGEADVRVEDEPPHDRDRDDAGHDRAGSSRPGTASGSGRSRGRGRARRPAPGPGSAARRRPRSRRCCRARSRTARRRTGSMKLSRPMKSTPSGLRRSRSPKSVNARTSEASTGPARNTAKIATKGKAKAQPVRSRRQVRRTGPGRRAGRGRVPCGSLGLGRAASRPAIVSLPVRSRVLGQSDGPAHLPVPIDVAFCWRAAAASSGVASPVVTRLHLVVDGGRDLRPGRDGRLRLGVVQLAPEDVDPRVLLELRLVPAGRHRRHHGRDLVPLGLDLGARDVLEERPGGGLVLAVGEDAEVAAADERGAGGAVLAGHRRDVPLALEVRAAGLVEEAEVPRAGEEHRVGARHEGRA